ncbi:P-loop containing nucleoside triphosphate hydrolase superfamily protein [Abeliophyllum distichum]|uniref:P-loop containing nucleoside triphosphate hydrolase superfamily protein n=1 Tax=Abeliophyllum distichum TaxID=126358 RepID=A0ABD1V5S0_9LAMI
MVLGVNWLSQIGPITFDFIQEHINFVKEGIEVTLTGKFEMITGPQMNSLMVQKAYGIIGQLGAIIEQEMMNNYKRGSMVAEKIQSLIIDPASNQEYKYYNGILRYEVKSHTMFGRTKQRGIVYKSLRDILGKEEGVDGEKIGVGRFVQVTILEIYNEEIYDLLPLANSGGRFGLGWSKGGSASKVKLEMMEKKAKNASFISRNEAGKILKEIEKVEKRMIIKNVVGYENVEQASQNGMEAKMQTAKINQGNIALKRVVESIANGDSHVPFKDSKLTMLLQDSFEDNKSKILMILCAIPSLKELHKTIATLEYGAKAKCIVRGPHTPIKEKGAEDSSLAVILGSRIEAMDQFIYMTQMESKLREKERNEAQKELKKKKEEISGLRTKLALVDGR